MASELRDTLQRLQHKSEVLIEKYHALSQQCQQLTQQLTQQQERCQQLEQKVQRLQSENEYMRMAHAVAPTPQAVQQSRAMIARIVRDIDRCIAQLNS